MCGSPDAASCVDGMDLPSQYGRALAATGTDCPGCHVRALSDGRQRLPQYGAGCACVECEAGAFPDALVVGPYLVARAREPARCRPAGPVTAPRLGSERDAAGRPYRAVAAAVPAAARVRCAGGRGAWRGAACRAGPGRAAGPRGRLGIAVRPHRQRVGPAGLFRWPGAGRRWHRPGRVLQATAGRADGADAVRRPLPPGQARLRGGGGGARGRCAGALRHGPAPARRSGRDRQAVEDGTGGGAEGQDLRGGYHHRSRRKGGVEAGAGHRYGRS